PPPAKVYLPQPVPGAPPEQEGIVIEIPVERAPRPRQIESVAPAEGVTAEVESLEALEPQHVRALEKYGPAAAEPAAPKIARRRFVLRPSTLRDAVVWTEILGRPKGEW
ncbi:MAG TPA: hypothetical protein VNI61_06290, partial [Gemmatimonadales bacterium]|nr:hypothetical protein [Gemmatimonadales bacterium]